MDGLKPILILTPLSGLSGFKKNDEVEKESSEEI